MREDKSSGGRDSNRPPSAGWTIPWSAVAMTLGVLTIASLGTLVVVVSIYDIDTLSTVALALAVVSFAAQLIVTMAQAQQSAQLTGETMAALADMRATTSSLLSNQREQFNTVLKALVSQAVPAAVDDVVAAGEQQDTPSEEQIVQLERALQSRLEQAIASASVAAVQPVPGDSHNSLEERRRRREAEREKRRREWDVLIESYPSREAGEPVSEILRSLPVEAVRELVEIGDTYRKMGGSPDGRGSLGVAVSKTGEEVSPEITTLADARLVRLRRTPIADAPPRFLMAHLTPEGTTALRILWAHGDPPDWAKGLPRRKS